MVKLFEILSEGGWASNLTQDTKLTPEVVKECVVLYDKFVKDFNKFLKTKDLPEVEAGEPKGSAHYYEKDLKDNPEKEYGDVDMLFYVPRLEGTTDNKNRSIYQNAVKEFCEGRDDIQTENGNFLIFKLANGKYAQIDLLIAYGENKEWAKGRMTPERGLKGAIGGFMYGALGEILNLSININGVQIKTKAGSPVKFGTVKDVELKTISRDISRFGIDICKFYYSNITGKDPKNMRISQSLQKTPGVNPEDMKNSDIAKMVKGIGDTLELNNLFGKKSLSNIDSKTDFINKVAKVYYDKMMGGIESSKYEKATGEEGQRKAQEAKDKLKAGLKQMLQYLK